MVVGDDRETSPGEFGTPRVAPYDAPMHVVGMVWHYWIGVVLAVAAVATVGGLAVNYLKSVESNRYPRES